jgi:hypothetical protein
MTRWHPDTCGCEVEYDDQINVTTVYKKCAKHSSTPDDATHLATMLAHNRKKNAVFNAIVEQGTSPAGLSVQYDANDDLNIVGHNLDLAGTAAVFTKVSSVLGTSKLNWK